MGDSGAGARAKRAGKTFVSASQSAARAGAAAAGGAGRAVHRVTQASGAGRTGLANLIELTAAGSVGDAFVAVALAGTLFFSASVDQARGRLALALIITIAPFAVLAPLIGPALDRARHGRRYILIGTLLARGLLCWGMAGAVQHNDALTLLPAAFGVLVLQKAYGVTRAAVTPRLLPSEITLVTANSRIAMASLIASSAGAGLAAGIAVLTNAGWVLRVATVIYLAAIVLGFRLPDGVDAPDDEPAAPAGATGRSAASGSSGGDTRPLPEDAFIVGGQRADDRQHGNGQPRPDGAQQADAGQHGNGAVPPTGQAGQQRKRLRFTWPRLSPQVTEAMRANAVLRAYSGFMIFFLAFILRTEHFGHTSDKVALGAMIGAAAVGGFLGTGIGSLLRSRAPQLIIYGMLALTMLVTAFCALVYGLVAALIVALAAALGQTLVKVALDAILQREIEEDRRSSVFAVSETLHQLSWVIGALAGLLMSLTQSGVAGLAFAAIGLACALGALLVARRRRIARRRAPQRV
jgi:MFS family permease